MTFRFASLLSRLDIELVLCVCWLDKMVLQGHCCVLQILLLPRHSSVLLWRAFVVWQPHPTAFAVTDLKVQINVPRSGFYVSLLDNVRNAHC